MYINSNRANFYIIYTDHSENLKLHITAENEQPEVMTFINPISEFF